MDTSGHITGHQQRMVYTTQSDLLREETDQRVTPTNINTIILNSQIPVRGQRMTPEPMSQSQIIPTQKTEPATPSPHLQIHDKGQRFDDSNPSPHPHQIYAKVERTEVEPSAYQIASRGHRMEYAASPQQITARGGQRLVMEGSPHPFSLGAQPPAVTRHQFVAGSGVGLRLPPIVASDNSIKPDISLCSRVLKSFSDQDQASSDLEVQSVMFPGTYEYDCAKTKLCIIEFYDYNEKDTNRIIDNLRHWEGN